jgi:hypothetical protein
MSTAIAEPQLPVSEPGDGRVTGKLVIVRAFEDEAVVMKVWEESEATVYVMAPVEYSKHVVGAPASSPIGFPTADVFEFDMDLYADLMAAYCQRDRAALADLWRHAMPIRPLVVF